MGWAQEAMREMWARRQELVATLPANADEVLGLQCKGVHDSFVGDDLARLSGVRV